MTKRQAIKSALRLAKKFKHTDYYVVVESGEYDSCTESDLSGFYAESHVVVIIVDNQVWHV